LYGRASIAPFRAIGRVMHAMNIFYNLFFD